MKNIKLNTSRKAGFSLVEMLVVIAIIGIIAAIAIPNIGNLNDSATKAAARRNAQTVASVVNAAIAAGASIGTDPADGTAIIALATGNTLSPTSGAFSGKTFSSGPINPQEVAAAASYLTWDTNNKQVIYNPGSY
jgi:type IV pilus assembly protein PilA